MSRTFYVDGTREVLMHVTQTVTWEVDADSFDEAERKVHNGGGDLYDVDDYTHDIEDSCAKDFNHNNVEEVRCGDCGESESYCTCDAEDEDDDDRSDAPGLRPSELRPGMWVEADAVTRCGWFSTSGPVMITEVSSLDSDGEVKVYFIDQDGDRDYWYVNDRAGRFLAVEAPEVDDDDDLAAVIEEVQAEQAEKERKDREYRALGDLLNV